MQNPEGEKEENICVLKKMQMQNQIAKTQNMASHERRYAINRGKDTPIWRAKYRSGFVTLPPELLQEQPRYGSFAGKAFRLFGC
jgi:hypothetical protein